MSFFLCKLWPYLAGGLIGWLLAGWFARRLKHSQVVEKVVEKEVERVVDNPQHLSLIGKLEKENSKIPDLVTKIAGFQSGGGKTVTVDNPKLLSRIKILEEENRHIAGLKSKLTAFESADPKVIEKVIEKEVEKIVEVDNPELLARIKTLEDDNKQISTLQSKLTALENAEPVVVEKLIEKEVETLVDNPQHLSKISDLEGQLEVYKRGPVIDVKAAKAAGIAIKDENDLTAIEGIGPKINDLIKADGIQTFAALSNTDSSLIQKTLDKAGSKYQMANPGTWPDQANLAANNRWPALKALQDVLIGGVYPDASKSGSSATSGSSSTAKSSKAKAVAALDISAAKEAGFIVRQKNGQDDFTLIEGVGPKINELIHADGIHTFTELAETKVERIQGILEKAGSRYSLANPGTWPAQSDMAASNRWKDLKAWQDELDGGR